MSRPPGFGEALRFWLKLGFISFGGPTGQIAIMHAELVERKKWIEEQRFLQALNFCMLLPGPEATQLATYCGWLLHGARGGIVAGILFVAPSILLLWGLSWIYVAQGNLPSVLAVFDGLKPAVTAIVAAAVIKIGQRALQTASRWVIATAAFVAIFFFRVPFPAIVAGAALLGSVRVGAGPVAAGPFMPASKSRFGSAATPRATWIRAVRVLLVCFTLWWLPVIIAGLGQGWHGILVREGVFFSQAALVTFGGAYAVLPYVGQQAVENYGWLNAAQMLDGLGLAETTPGPLIMVVQFVGFLGGWNHPGGNSPLLMATLGAAITTWTTFVPCFLWIFLGAPHIEQLHAHPWLSGALSAVTAAVVGVVLNLAVWFGLQVFFPSAESRPGKIDWFAVVLAIAAFTALQRFKWSIVTVVLASGAAGLIWARLAPV